MKKMEELITLLTCPAWTVHELIKYGELTGIRFGRSTAYAIMQQLKLEKGAKVRYATNAVYSDYVLNYFGIDRERELKLLGGIFIKEKKEK